MVSVIVGAVTLGIIVCVSAWAAMDASASRARAVLLIIHLIATSIHTRWEFIVRKPRKPIAAIPKRLENQNRGTENIKYKDELKIDINI